MLLTKLGVPKLWREDPEVIWSYMRYFVAPVTLLLARPAGYGVENIPAAGGGVIAANHFSGIDHPLIGVFSPRPVYYLAKAELFEVPVFGELLPHMGVIPLRRGEGDRDALRAAREAARGGALIGVHVEGTRQRFGHPGPVHTGGLMIAMQEGVPIIPVGLDTFRWSPTNGRRCSLVWGEPIDLSDLPRRRPGYERAAEIVGAEIVRLWRLAAGATAAGFPAELPDGTRRSRPVLPGWKPLPPAASDREPARAAGVSH